jgi:hypothetical protein
MRLVLFPCLFVIAAGCSVLYPLDYRSAAPDALVPADATLDALPDAAGPPLCPAGFDRCAGGACLDTRTSTDHCGACNNVCALANAVPACEGGRCVPAACNPGFADCDGDPTNGCETSTQSSLAHCGRCNNACPTAGGTSVCRDGVCRVGACAGGFASCDGNDANGCETDTRSSLEHCGACRRPCVRANATARCTAGLCAVGACGPGFANCDGNDANGCETDLRSSLAHCGACAIRCAGIGGTPACIAGSCRITCDTGRGNCDGDAANGCETDLQTAPAHCGACGSACPAGQSCSRGRCMAGCASGLTACGPACVDLANDPANCSACRLTCAGATNAASTCRSSRCGFTCLPGFDNCDGNPANGCESSLATVDHCGRCGLRCPSDATGTAVCSDGACDVVCAPGRGNCNRDVADGCEIEFDTNARHCGACGNRCEAPNGTPLCRAGVCAIEQCDANRADCDAAAANGCEVDTRTDPAHCGGCNRACALANATPTCASGICRVAMCNAGFRDCDGDPANGCEINTVNNPRHCGACGQVCAPGASCVNSTCCGAPGLPCCPGGQCVGGLASCNVAQRCVAVCGGSSQPCCLLGPACVAGLRCLALRCVP